MNRFHIIDDSPVILRSKGVYRQAKVFRRATSLFAAHGAGFIRLMGGNGTSVPGISWLELECPIRTGVDQFGAPVLQDDPA